MLLRSAILAPCGQFRLFHLMPPTNDITGNRRPRWRGQKRPGKGAAARFPRGKSTGVGGSPSFFDRVVEIEHSARSPARKGGAFLGLSSSLQHGMAPSPSQRTCQLLSPELEAIRSSKRPPTVDGEMKPLHVGIDPRVRTHHVHQEPPDLQKSC